MSSSAASPVTATDDLTSTATTTPGADEYDTGNSTPYPSPAEVEVNELACIVELDDVLEASFLDDSMDRECEASVGSSSFTPTSGAASGRVEDPSTTLTSATTTPSLDSTAAVEASNKHLTRWDVISIGAFRQTREQQQQQAWAPGSRSSSTVADYGGVIKNGASAAGSPLSALLWQNSGAGSSSTGVGSRKNTTSSIPTSSSTLKTSSSRSSTKAAKRRRLMMASSTMSSPLVLPLSSTSLSTQPSKFHSSSPTPYSHSHSQPNNPSQTHKTRKELRREKKLLKKKTPTSSSPSSSSMPQPFFSTHPNNASNNNINHHHFHTHQHHPNSKMRGMSSSQRVGYFGGAVPPLNL